MPPFANVLNTVQPIPVGRQEAIDPMEPPSDQDTAVASQAFMLLSVPFHSYTEGWFSSRLFVCFICSYFLHLNGCDSLVWGKRIYERLLKKSCSFTVHKIII